MKCGHIWNTARGESVTLGAVGIREIYIIIRLQGPCLKLCIFLKLMFSVHADTVHILEITTTSRQKYIKAL